MPVQVWQTSSKAGCKACTRVRACCWGAAPCVAAGTSGDVIAGAGGARMLLPLLQVMFECGAVCGSGDVIAGAEGAPCVAVGSDYWCRRRCKIAANGCCAGARHIWAANDWGVMAGAGAQALLRM
eukprot:833983-Pelagomonas_calceolata.AAC.6